MNVLGPVEGDARYIGEARVCEFCGVPATRGFVRWKRYDGAGNAGPFVCDSCYERVLVDEIESGGGSEGEQLREIEVDPARVQPGLLEWWNGIEVDPARVQPGLLEWWNGMTGKKKQESEGAKARAEREAIDRQLAAETLAETVAKNLKAAEEIAKRQLDDDRKTSYPRLFDLDTAEARIKARQKDREEELREEQRQERAQRYQAPPTPRYSGGPLSGGLEEKRRWLDPETTDQPKKGDLVPAIELKVRMVPFQGESLSEMYVRSDIGKATVITMSADRGATAAVELPIESAIYQAIEVFLRCSDKGWKSTRAGRTVYVRVDDKALFEAVLDVANLDWMLALRQAMAELYGISDAYSNDAQPRALKRIKKAINSIADEIQEKFKRPVRRFARVPEEADDAKG